MPHLAVLLGGSEWRNAVALTSILAAVGGAACFFIELGPHHARASRFSPRAIQVALQNKQVRLAYLGYLGHMWELYAMWAWIGVAAAAAYSVTMDVTDAQVLGTRTAFLAIALGGPAWVAAGWAADRNGVQR
jgi:hypothetical protein